MTSACRRRLIAPGRAWKMNRSKTLEARSIMIPAGPHESFKRRS